MRQQALSSPQAAGVGQARAHKPGSQSFSKKPLRGSPLFRNPLNSMGVKGGEFVRIGQHNPCEQAVHQGRIPVSAWSLNKGENAAFTSGLLSAPFSALRQLAAASWLSASEVGPLNKGGHEQRAHFAISESGSQDEEHKEIGGRKDVAIPSLILDTPPSAPFSEAYRLGHLIGRGTFGHVCECTEIATGNTYAAKMVPQSVLTCPDAREDIRREVLLMQRLRGRHRNVVQLKETRVTPKTVVLVMELCEGGDLFGLLNANGSLPEPAARLIFRQLASAVHLCHSLRIVHCDIKLENVFLTGPALSLYTMTSADVPATPVQAKLGDFGLSQVLPRGSFLTTILGSKRYTAPELLRGEPYGTSVDIWSLGVVLFAMLSGYLPFTGLTPNDDNGLKKAILSGRPSFDQHPWCTGGVSAEAVHFVSLMLQVDVCKRASSLEVLAHPWLREPAAPDPIELATIKDGPLAVPRLQVCCR